MATPEKATVRAWLAVRHDLSGQNVSMNQGAAQALNIESARTCGFEPYPQLPTTAALTLVRQPCTMNESNRVNNVSDNGSLK